MTENHTNRNGTTVSTTPDAEGAPPPFFLKYDDAECADWLVQHTCQADPASLARLAHPTVMARLCAFADDLFLHTILRLAASEKAGLDLLAASAVLTRLAAVPAAQYQGVFATCAERVLGLNLRAYEEQLRPYLQRHQAEQDAAAAPSATATLAATPDDDQFCEDLLEWIRANANCRVNPMILEDAGIIARLCALPDHRFTPTLLDLAKPECLGLDILYDERLMPRLARMRRGHLRGTFLPYARQLKGFAEHDFLRELRQAQQALHASSAATGAPVLLTMYTVERQPITWLWYPYIALGKLAIFDGDPGTGKSLTVANLAARLSQGHPLPDQEGRPTFPTGTKHATLLLANEDGLADTLKGRLEDAGADCAQIHVLTGWADASGDEHLFSFQDMPILEKAIAQVQPRLVVIDPVQAYLGAEVDMHRANQTRPLLEALRRLAEQYQCAIVCIRHMAKAHQGGKAMLRGLGSVDFIGAARTGLLVEQHPTDPTKVLMAQTKSNIGPLGVTQMFSKDGGQFEWCGTSRLTAEMLAGSGRGPDPYAFLEAVIWLEERLGDGFPVAATDLGKEAEEEGLSFPTLRRAKKALKVESIKRGKDKQGKERWDWRLPPLRTIPTPTPLLSLASRETLEHVQPHQAVSGAAQGSNGFRAQGSLSDLRQPGEDEAPHPGEEGSIPPAEVVENMEDVQETQEAQEAEEAPRSAPPRPKPPTHCPSCHKWIRSWIDRGAYWQCSEYHCPGRVPIR
jgi:hypothetical protein